MLMIVLMLALTLALTLELTLALVTRHFRTTALPMGQRLECEKQQLPTARAQGMR
jgi:hypothetical protein